jgi:ATP-dependent Lhr-like helicase
MTMLDHRLAGWFSKRGWQIHPHQNALLKASNNRTNLLIAPTGAGKTLAGFLPTLHELVTTPHSGLHTIYVSPLKALAADIRRNLSTPISELDLPIRVEDRTGDTPASRRKRQRADPPHILLTTPESLALLMTYEDAPRMFAGTSRIIIDEIHALADSKRGTQLMLALTRLQSICPDLKRVGLSATIEDPKAMAAYLAPTGTPCHTVFADPGPDPDITMLQTEVPPPWSGGGGTYAIHAILDEVAKHRTTLIFHNTRAQAEIFFQNLWHANADNLPIGIHHGSLAREQRERVEAAMVAGQLRAIVCTGSLDLGIDWGDVDLVVQVGAPKNVKRLVQRIGRANHRYNAPSKAILVPANRFEVIECVAALQAVLDHDLDGDPRGPGPRDVLCQHIMAMACSGPINADRLFAEVSSFSDYAALTRSEFDDCLDFVATGGYALRAYDRWQRLKQAQDGNWHLRDPRAGQRIRMNLGTIQDTDTVKVHMRNRRGGKPLGEIEEAFAATLTPGDTFVIGGKIVRYEDMRELVVIVSPEPGRKPKFAVFSGTKFATSTQLSHRILKLIHSQEWSDLPEHTQSWLTLQKTISLLPDPGKLLIESFEHDGKEHVCIYGFAGRNAMQTLGLLITKRLEDLGLNPLGFVATDYAVLIWGLNRLHDPQDLLDITELRQSFDEWLSGNAVMKRTFRTAATIAGLIERRSVQGRSSGRQATFSSDILYDTLRKYDPGHLMMQITREEAMKGLVDFGRIEEMINRTRDNFQFVRAPHVTPFAAPLFLEIGKIPIEGAGNERLITEQATALMEAAGLA